MKAGDIYDVIFPFKPPLPADGSLAKGQPALIISVSQDGTVSPYGKDYWYLLQITDILTALKLLIGKRQSSTNYPMQK